ncbi:MAG TPA: phosphate ABC transporter permease subunit PstC [Actinomycetota bacterium]|nr:phosphate ABC transporter permease subunit PstC [Actinomycetota bacterium]
MTRAERSRTPGERVAATEPGVARALSGRRRYGERLVRTLLLGCAVVSVATTLGIVASLGSEAVAFFRQVPVRDYLTGTSWGPTFRPPAFGVLPLLTATVLIGVTSMVVAVPVGLGTALYLSEYARPAARRVLKPVLEVLAGVPTVVFGYFALTFITPALLQRVLPGTGVFNALSASLAIGLMAVPLVASVSEDAMRAVPGTLREAAFAMGATRRTVALRVVVPAALSGIAAAVILGLSRAIGETMIVAIAAGQMPNLSLDPREAMQTMTAYIVQISMGDTPYGSVEYRTIFAVGATLFLLTLGLNALSLRLVRRTRERYG